MRMTRSSSLAAPHPHRRHSADRPVVGSMAGPRSRATSPTGIRDVGTHGVRRSFERMIEREGSHALPLDSTELLARRGLRALREEEFDRRHRLLVREQPGRILLFGRTRPRHPKESTNALTILQFESACDFLRPNVFATLER